jgi:hypothetical protein
MGWVRLDDQLYANAKVVACPPDAFKLFIMGLTWVSSNLTDGYLPSHIVKFLSSPRSYLKLSETLVRVGLWDKVSEEDGWRVHNYLTYNPSEQEVKARKKGVADRVARYKETHQAAQDNALVTRYPDTESDALVTPPPSHPIPSHIVTKVTTSFGPVTESEPEPNPAPKVAAKPKTKRKCQFPPDFVFEERMREWTSAVNAAQQGATLEEEFDKFRDWHTARGSIMADWGAAFRTWLGNYRPRPRQLAPASITPGTRMDGLRAIWEADKASRAVVEASGIEVPRRGELE